VPQMAAERCVGTWRNRTRLVLTVIRVIVAVMITVTANRHQNARTQINDQQKRDQYPYLRVDFHVCSPFFCS
jgi:hypothetical protein